MTARSSRNARPTSSRRIDARQGLLGVGCGVATDPKGVHRNGVRPFVAHRRLDHVHGKAGRLESLQPPRFKGEGQVGVIVIWNTWFEAPVARKVLLDVLDTVE